MSFKTYLSHLGNWVNCPHFAEQSHSLENWPNVLMPKIYPNQKMHPLATVSPYGSLSVVVGPVFAPGWPFVLRPEPTGQCLAVTWLVDLPLVDFDLMADLTLVLPLVVLVLLPVQPQLVLVLAPLLLGLVPVPLLQLVPVQVVDPPALLCIVANWEVPGLLVDLQRTFLEVLPQGVFHLLLGFQQYATEMIIPDFQFWCPGSVFQESVTVVQTRCHFEHAIHHVSL